MAVSLRRRLLPSEDKKSVEEKWSEQILVFLLITNPLPGSQQISLTHCFPLAVTSGKLWKEIFGIFNLSRTTFPPEEL